MPNPEADKLSDEAQQLLNEGRYALAAGRLDQAIALDPAKPNAYVRRARAALGSGDLPAAARDLRRALELGDAAAEAGALASELAAAMERGGLQAQAKELLRLANPAGPDHSAPRDGGAAEPAQRSRLFLCGLGPGGPGLLTVNALTALSRCKVLYLERSRAAEAAFLARLCADVRLFDSEVLKDARAFVDSLPQQDCALVLDGHPLYRGELAQRLSGASRSWTCEVLDMPGPLGVALARLKLALGRTFAGIQAVSHIEVPRADWTASPDLPLLVYFSEPDPSCRFEQVVAALRKRFAPDTEALLVEARPGGAIRRASLAELEAGAAPDPDSVLVLLPRGAVSADPGQGLSRRKAAPGRKAVPRRSEPPPWTDSSEPPTSDALGRLESAVLFYDGGGALEYLDAPWSRRDLEASELAQLSADVEALLRAEPRSPRLLGLKGRLLLAVAQPTAALKALEGALPSRYPGRVHAWRARGEFALGRFEEGLSELESAVAAAQSFAWEQPERALSGLRLEDLPVLCERLQSVPARTGHFVALALRALALRALGREDESLALLAAAAEGPGWLQGLRAAMLRRARKPADALRCLEPVLARDASWSLRLERVAVLKMAGRGREALAEATTLAQQASSEPLIFLLRGQIAAALRQDEEAIEDFSRAIALDPDCAVYRAQRAWAHVRRGEDDAALSDIDAALRCDPLSPDMQAARVRLLLQMGREPEAASALDSILGDAAATQALRGTASLERGLLRLSDSRFAEAAEDLSRSPDSGAAAYAALARLFAAEPPEHSPAAGRAAALIVCGLGAGPPGDATWETLLALRRCDVLFGNFTEDIELTRFLRLFSKDVRPAPTDLDEAVADAAAVLRAGGRVGFVTRGHPMVYASLATLLARECERLKVSCEVLPAVSSAETIPTRESLANDFPLRGIQVWDAEALRRPGASLNHRLPLLVYCSGVDTLPVEAYEAFCGSLERRYRPGTACSLYETGYERPTRSLPLGSLRGLRGALKNSDVLFFAPLEREESGGLDPVAEALEAGRLAQADHLLRVAIGGRLMDVRLARDLAMRLARGWGYAGEPLKGAELLRSFESSGFADGPLRAERARQSQRAGRAAEALEIFHALPGSASLSLVSVGPGPGQTSLEALAELERCDVVFHDLDPGAEAELRPFARGPRPISGESSKDVERILAEVAHGKTVGFATRVGALAEGGLGLELRKACEARGFPARTYDAVSAAGAALAHLRFSVGTDVEGFQWCSWERAVRSDWSPNTAVPLLLVIGPKGPDQEQSRLLRDRITELYGKSAWALRVEMETSVETGPAALKTALSGELEPQGVLCILPGSLEAAHLPRPPDFRDAGPLRGTANGIGSKDLGMTASAFELTLNDARADSAVRARALLDRGLLWLKRGETARARVDLDACRIECGGTTDSELPVEQALFYATVARVLERTPARADAGPGLSVIGLGYRPPWQATPQALAALACCDVVFNNLPKDDDTRAFLGLFCADVRPVLDEHEMPDPLFEEARRGRRVGFATRGHPLLYGPTSSGLIKRATAGGIPFEVIPGVSSMDVLAGRMAARSASGVDGLQIFTPTLVLSPGFRADPGLPALIFFDEPLPKADFPRFCAGLAASYPAHTPCWAHEVLLKDDSSEISALADLPRRERRLFSLLVGPRTGDRSAV